MRVVRAVSTSVAAVATVVALAGAAAAVPANPAPHGTLTGYCERATDKIDVTATAAGRGLWAPYRFDRGGYTLIPYQLTYFFDEASLKTRHLLPGVPYTKPGPRPASSVTCTFAGVVVEDGVKSDFTVFVVGTLR